MGDIALWLSMIMIMGIVGGIIYAWASDESVFDLIEIRFFYRLAVLALLLYGIHLGSSIHDHFHSIEDLLQKIETAVNK